MNASHASTADPGNLYPVGTRPVHLRTALLVLYAALAAQLAIWSSLAAHVGLTAAFTQAHHGAAANVVVAAPPGSSSSRSPLSPPPSGTADTTAR